MTIGFTAIRCDDSKMYLFIYLYEWDGFDHPEVITQWPLTYMRIESIFISANDQNINKSRFIPNLAEYM